MLIDITNATPIVMANVDLSKGLNNSYSKLLLVYKIPRYFSRLFYYMNFSNMKSEAKSGKTKSNSFIQPKWRNLS